MEELIGKLHAAGHGGFGVLAEGPGWDVSLSAPGSGPPTLTLRGQKDNWEWTRGRWWVQSPRWDASWGRSWPPDCEGEIVAALTAILAVEQNS